jgi:Cu/Zn superoxide dismutase
VPTNRVTGSGTATVSLNGEQATVTLHTHDLLAGSPHAMHIHAGGQGVCPPASAARLHNGHLSISTTNGIHFYGPPEVALTSHGDTSPKSIIDFARYPSVAAIPYKRTVTVPRGIADAIRAGNAVIVVHGIDYNHNGIYDDVLDRSELKATLPGEATAPALCGPLHTGAVTATRRRGGGIVYAATLHPYDPALSAEERSFRLLCRLAGVPA